MAQPDPPVESTDLVFLHLDQVLEKVALSKAEFYRRTKRTPGTPGYYPPARKDGKRSFWVKHEIEACQRRLLAAA